ncbi:(deoxy)nucleoside triphosphate pyrophosphohydrolase [Carboxydocella sp. ULO1]|uniref:(deoxy)nucleoside triphosphate pyrophosphohydrolase n=1 Tax=Carboxydocella sp. ULO1 TaxID=1926599 RepID=UPI00135658CD|nr:(deoxy)nucleoside triphosphate pyrophosphohydrolase [Carboxydocella sp. ULO1]
MERIVVTAAAIWREGELLLAQRRPGSHLAGMWEFPGGKLEIDEAPEEGLKREIKEELNIDIHILGLATVVWHRYEDRVVLLLVYHCQLQAGELQGMEGQAIGWFSPKAALDLELAPADRTILENIINGGPGFEQPAFTAQTGTYPVV